jgi:hypothetical protein
LAPGDRHFFRILFPGDRVVAHSGISSFGDRPSFLIFFPGDRGVPPFEFSPSGDRAISTVLNFLPSIVKNSASIIF